MQRNFLIAQAAGGDAGGDRRIQASGFQCCTKERCLTCGPPFPSCRPLAGTQVVIGACVAALMAARASATQTVLLFTARALSMGSYAILYVYTPEARTSCRTYCSIRALHAAAVMH